MADDLATRIRSRREDLGMTRAELAEAVGRAPSTVGSWEQGRSRPAPETLAALMGLLGLDDLPGAEPEVDEGTSFVLDLSDFEEVVTSVDGPEDESEPESGVVDVMPDDVPEPASDIPDLSPEDEPEPAPEPAVATPENELAREPEPPPPSLEPVKAPDEAADVEPMVAPEMTPATVVVDRNRRRAARKAKRVAGPAAVGTVQPIRTDSDPMYRVRAIATFAAIGLLAAVFLWAFAEAGSAVGEVISTLLDPFVD